MAKVSKRKDEPLDKALRKFKSKLKQERIFEEVRRREFYEKPSQRRRRREEKAKRREMLRRTKEE